MKTFFLPCLFLSLLFVVSALATENTSLTLTAGSFGVAWLDDDGIIRLYNGTDVTTPVPGVKVFAILAADLLDEDSDQLAYLDDGRKALHIHSFKTQKSIGPFGYNVRTMAAGHRSPEKTVSSLFVCTFNNETFQWTKDAMDSGGWVKLSGGFVQAARGRFDRRSDLDDFAVVTEEGNVYIYSMKWQTYSKVVEGSNIAAILAGNFTTAPGDEIAMIGKDGSVFLSQNRTLENIAQKAKCLAVRRNSDGLDTLYAINNEGKIVHYDRETKTWKKLLSDNDLVFNNLVVRDDQTVFAISNANLYKISGGTVTQLSSLPPAAMVLHKDGTPLARYRFGSVPFKPYVDELRTPSGQNILRDAPHDHLHHHGLMYAIKVGDCSFWAEWDGSFGKQVTVQCESEDGRLITEIDWNTPQSKTLLKEVRQITVEQKDNVTLLDWKGALTAQVDTVLGDSYYYYGLGMRFDETMDKGGRFFNDTGKHDGRITRDDERLKPCQWMAYTTKLHGQPVTVAMFDHPSNPVPMTAFTMGETGNSFAYISATMNLHPEPVELKSGETFAFQYRVAVWDGEVSPETVEKTYADFVR
jgi:hypothetical protein